MGVSAVNPSSARSRSSLQIVDAASWHPVVVFLLARPTGKGLHDVASTSRSRSLVSVVSETLCLAYSHSPIIHLLNPSIAVAIGFCGDQYNCGNSHEGGQPHFDVDPQRELPIFAFKDLDCDNGWPADGISTSTCFTNSPLEQIKCSSSLRLCEISSSF